MKTQNEFPETLIEAVRYFSNPDNCLNFMVQIRWPNGITCPRCESKEHSFLSTRRIWKCKGCKKQFSVKVGTIFEDSPIGLDKWLPAVWLIVNCKNGVSSYEIHREIGVTQKTAWFMLHRIRFAMQRGSFLGKFSGEVEADETFIGGLARNMHKHKREEKVGHGPVGKTIVMGLLERHGEKASQIKAMVVPNTGYMTLQKEVRKHVEPGSDVFTDESSSYTGLRADYVHQFVNHAEKYVEGRVHTNGLENFWSLLKRGLRGTYVSVEPFHLFRYLDEQSFRFNERKADNALRFKVVMSTVAGRRLTYKKLTGKDMEPSPAAIN